MQPIVDRCVFSLAVLDLRLAAIRPHLVPAILIAVRERAMKALHWDKLLKRGSLMTLECMKHLLGHALTDTPVERSARVLTFPDSPTFGDFEDAGLVAYEIEVRSCSPLVHPKLYWIFLCVLCQGFGMTTRAWCHEGGHCLGCLLSDLNGGEGKTSFSLE